ncbi:helix-turn-helix domain-containing protein [Falsiroseomonas oryzae]|uniref:helix-turn-helix domain-containing protein n=1 Tax=Falsiroseomonas oryzae TaxID=2766473 RepID=UPI0022EA6B40|nr:helix-turn-helix domain-containing protein [Roseomonas sp. MO-31]
METNRPVIPNAARAVPRGVRIAILYMREALERRITAEELSRVTGVVPRTLHRQFLAFVGEAPLAHFQSMRLSAVHDALLSPAHNAITVTDVATRFGFAHLGRFSAAYRRRFGENPSATLMRGQGTAAQATLDPKDARSQLQFSRQCSAADFRLPHVAVHRQAPSLVMMPIRSVAARMDERLLAEAVAEELAKTLFQSYGISVRLARSSPAQGARLPAARHCLAGQVSSLASGGMRVVLYLVDLAAEGRHVWGDAFEGAESDIFGLRDRIVLSAGLAIQQCLKGADQRVELVRSPAELNACGLLSRAMPFVLAADSDSARRALELVEQAADLDPLAAAPVALQAWCRMQLVLYHQMRDPAAGRSEAQALAARAAELDQVGDPSVLTARSCVATWAGQADLADALLARALAINPSFAWAWERSACLQLNYGKAQRSITQYRRAISLKERGAPLANCWAGLGGAYLSAGRHAEAAVWHRRALTENPRANWLNVTLVPCLIALDARQEARVAVRRLRDAYAGISVERVAASLPGPILDAWKSRLDQFVELGLPA